MHQQRSVVFRPALRSGHKRPMEYWSERSPPRSGTDVMTLAEDECAFMLKTTHITGWQRELRFAPPRRWRFDFAWPQQRIALEIEGGTWVGGRHNRGAGYVNDLEKYNTATLLGWRLLRVTPEMVSDGTALSLIEALLDNAQVAAK